VLVSGRAVNGPCYLCGELEPWPTRARLVQILIGAGIHCYEGRYSIRLANAERFIFQHYGGDICEPQIEAETATPERLYNDALRVSAALAAADIRHRFELYNGADREFAYLQHHWQR
jgi:hypothetical protein